MIKMITEKVVTAAYCNTGYDIFDIFGYALKITTFCSKKCQVTKYQNVKNVIARDIVTSINLTKMSKMTKMSEM